MSVAPARESDADGSGGKRRIGDILLELGFISDEALAKAADEQERTGQPLGQILVEHGAITRLELASALAEQWSDQVSITPLPVPTGPPRVVPQQPVHHDDDHYAARLQEAVADLTQRVRLPDNENPLDGRLVELAERVESTVARTQRLEATVATLVDSLEGVTGGVEEAFGVLQSGMSGLAMDLARIETTVTELNAHPAEPAVDPALAARIDELWRFVHELADRPLKDDDARDKADELAARLEGLADRASLDEVQGSLEGLHGSLADLGELRIAVAELVDRPSGSRDLDAQLERLEARLNEQAAAAADTGAVESLAGRLDAALATQGALEASLRAIDERLELLARDVASRADASLAEHVATVEGRLTGLVSDEELSLALERTREELASVPPEPDPRIDLLARDLVAVRDELHEATAARLEAVEARLEAELASSTDPEAAKALVALSERIEELSRERHHQAELAAKVDALEQRVPTDTVTADELASVRAELYQATAGRLEAIEERIPTDTVSAAELDAALVRTRTELVPPPQEPDPEAARALAALSERIEELSAERHLQQELASRLDEVDGRLADVVTGDELSRALAQAREELAAPPPEPDPRIGGTLARLEAVEARLEAGLATSTDPEAAKALAALSERIEELSRERQHQEELSAKLAALESRIPTESITAPELAEALAELRQEQPHAPEASPELDGVVEELTSRLAVLEELAAAAEPWDETPGGEAVEEEMERFRMTIERLSMHIAEHDRTLAEMRSARGVTQRLDELTAQVDALAAEGVGSPDGAPGRRREPGFGRDLEPNEMRQLIRRIEDCEEAAHEGREKLMNRLERMASSIDWRLQRLESAGDEESSSQE